MLATFFVLCSFVPVFAQVPETEVFSVSLDTEYKSVPVGSTFTLTATYAPTNIYSSIEKKWAVNKTSGSAEIVAQSDRQVIVKALEPGHVTVSYTMQGDIYYGMAVCTVQITDEGTSRLDSVELNYTEASLDVGKTLQLVPTITPANATITSEQWDSSDENVARVDSNGLVTAISQGEASINYTVNDVGYSTVGCKITVTKNGVFSKEISLSTYPEGAGTVNGEGDYPVGDEITLTTQPNDGNEFIGWFSVANYGTGLASAEPDYTFTAEWNTPLEYIAVYKTGTETGMPYYFSVASDPVGAGYVSGSRVITEESESNVAYIQAIQKPGWIFDGWYIGNELISNERSYAYEVTETNRIVAKFTEDPNYTGPTSAVLNPSTNQTLQIGEGLVVSVAPEPEGSGNPQGSTLEFEGLNGQNYEDILDFYPENVTNENRIVGKAPGQVRITGQLEEGITSEPIIITVEEPETPQYEVELLVSPQNSGSVIGDLSYASGSTATLQAIGDNDSTFTGWYNGQTLVSTQNPYTFTVNGNQTYTAVFNGGTPDVPTNNLTITPASLTLAPGGTQQLSAKTGTTTLSSGVSWTSDNTAVATVSSSGTVTAVAEGTATITATYEDQTATATVTVTSSSLTISSIMLDPTALNLTTLGQTATISATISPSSWEGDVSWSITPTSVATIDQSTTNPKQATVTAVSDGQATVTVTAGGKTATAQVRVNTNPVTGGVTISGQTPDAFTVSATIPSSAGQVKSVSVYTWSTADQSDMNCKVIPPSSQGSSTFSYAFPINDTPVNEHYNNADLIKVHVYATMQDGTVSLLEATTYDWMDASSVAGKNVVYTTYSQNNGFNSPSVYGGEMSGTEGRTLGLEGIRISSPIEGVQVSTDVHVEDIGWINNVADGTYAGTMGQNKQIEAVRFTLTGPNSGKYRIEYQVHGENYGWQGWTSQGQEAGTTGQNLQIEAIQVRIVEA